MRPIAAGPDVKRFATPPKTECLLFPYLVSKKQVELISSETMASKYPKAWAHLDGYSDALRERERRRYDKDSIWYCFSRPQNMEKQAAKKLLIAGTAPELRVYADENGEFAFLGGRVYGILPSNDEDLLFLMGILNSNVPNFVFKRIARPKAGGFFDIETQFLAPLPIPTATPKQKQQVGELAKRLQELHTARRDKLLLIDQRLTSDQTAEVKDFKKALNADLAAIDMRLHPGAVLSVEHSTGELRFLVGGVPVIKDVFVDESAIDFLAAQWRHIARTTSVTEKFTGKKLVGALEKVRKTDNAALKSQVVRLDREIQDLDQEIEIAESAMNDLVYKLYDLSDDERKMVEADRI